MSGMAQTVDDTALLLHRCGSGDRAAFRALYDRWSGRLHGIALRITRESSLAADATHDAFVQIWREAYRFDLGRGTPEAFLISLVRYRALDIVRRRQRERPGYEPDERADESPDALARMVSSSEGAALQRCMERLDPERRQIVAMAFINGLSHGELAARLRMPLGTVKSTIRRSLLSLRECLAS
jgi:RNA polymerase sigma-70 factor (ECF subfamily)